MRTDQIVAMATNHFLARVIRRVLAAMALIIFCFIALYYFTAAGMIALDGQVGALNTRLIVGGVYAALALISLIVLWAGGRIGRTRAATPALNGPREMQLVMLVEAVMLGYALARKRERA